MVPLPSTMQFGLVSFSASKSNVPVLVIALKYRLASVEACLPEESSTDSSISTLSSVPSSIIAMHFSENVNESNRADVDTFHDDRGDAYSIVDPIKPVEKEGSGTVDNNAPEIPTKKRRNNKTEGNFFNQVTLEMTLNLLSSYYSTSLF